VLRVRLLFFSGRRRGTAALRRIRRGRAGVLLGTADGTEQPPEQENQHDDTGNGGDASATVDLGWQRWLGITGWRWPRSGSRRRKRSPEFPDPAFTAPDFSRLTSPKGA